MTPTAPGNSFPWSEVRLGEQLPGSVFCPLREEPVRDPCEGSVSCSVGSCGALWLPGQRPSSSPQSTAGQLKVSSHRDVASTWSSFSLTPRLCFCPSQTSNVLRCKACRICSQTHPAVSVLALPLPNKLFKSLSFYFPSLEKQGFFWLMEWLRKHWHGVTEAPVHRRFQYTKPLCSSQVCGISEVVCSWWIVAFFPALFKLFLLNR